MKQKALETRLSILRITIYSMILFCFANNAFTQAIKPTSLHFVKDYQVRNFYNSTVLLGKLDLTQDLSNESIYPKVHFTSPGCAFKQIDEVLKIFNHSNTTQESYINLGKLYNYTAIDMDINKQNNSSNVDALLSLYKDKTNRFVIVQQVVDSGNIQISLEILQNTVLQILLATRFYLLVLHFLIATATYHFYFSILLINLQPIVT